MFATVVMDSLSKKHRIQNVLADNQNKRKVNCIMFTNKNGIRLSYRYVHIAFLKMLLHYLVLSLALVSSVQTKVFLAEENQIEFVPSLTGATEFRQKRFDLVSTNVSYTEIKESEIVSERTLKNSDSPFVVLQNLEIAKNAKLIIEPGVTIQFAPGVGLTVFGILEAIGTPSSRISLKAQGELLIANQRLLTPEEKGVRLVDGPTPLEGRLELFHKGSWRAVCSNSKNWTMNDYKVTCTQLGFSGGRFWNWIERNRGFKSRILFETPECTGNEKSLLECSWQSRQVGAGVCDYHSDIGIQCTPRFSSKTAHWQGIRFVNAPYTKTLKRDNIVYSAHSKSTLKYVNIYEAGVAQDLVAMSAVEVLGQPPTMEHIAISHSAYTGFNVTKPFEGFTLTNITVRESNGIGIFVNSSQGGVLVENGNIINNAADGIKYVVHDLRPEERTDRATLYDFCTLPTTSFQTYPISLVFTQKFYAGSSKECSKYFFTKPGYKMTVHFEYFVLKTNETLMVQIFDGATINDRMLFEWKARNFTRPQSVTSTREKLFMRLVGDVREEINAYFRITAGEDSAYDLLIRSSVIEDNAGRGLVVDNIRSKLHVDGSTVSNNGHVAGIHITSGAGDINITNSKITFNQGDGLNITYYGGNRNISRSVLHFNKGYGLAVWLNETTNLDRTEYIALNQSTVIEYSQISSNLETGILHGNFCAPIWINITGNNFNDSLGNDISIESCWQLRKQNAPNLFLQIGHNMFQNSKKICILMSPALNLQGKIEYNQYYYGSYGALYIRNENILPEFNLMTAKLLIHSNYFMRNKGVYVVSLGLSPFSRKDVQFILFTKNFLRENKIVEPFGPLIYGSEGKDGSGRLNPRSKVAAAVVVGSQNVDIFRNILHNLDSNYEIGSQLLDQSQYINATYNWLGHTEEIKIYERLFHRNDRYNLAKIEYLPYLLHSSNPSSTTIISSSTMVPQFFKENSGIIGGEVDGQEMIPAGIYTVNKDINIRPGGKLILQPGVTLKFEPSVGMMVAGKLEARGRHPDDILMTLKRETIIDGGNETIAGDEESDILEAIDMETEAIFNDDDEGKVPLRLLGGLGPYEGRLQVYMNGQWGTVCDYGWTMINAALSCNQLGYTLNPQDWRLFRSEMPKVGDEVDVLISNVQCTEHDLDLTKCRSEKLYNGDFENSCSHENDVGLRCYEGAWAGLRFSMLAERADLQYLTVEKAGLFDYTTNLFKPAVQMDFSRHNLENLRVVDNLDDGLGIIYSDIYSGRSVNNIKNSEFSGNKGNGISVTQLELRIHGSVIKNNRGSGVMHNPVISALDQAELAGWFRVPFEHDYNPYTLGKDTGNIDLNTWESKYIRTEESLSKNVVAKLSVRCPAGYVLGIQLLNPNNLLSSEKITIFDSQTENNRSEIWIINRDLTVFPITSSSYGIVILYESGENALGGAVLLVTTVNAPIQNIPKKIVRASPPTLTIRSTKIQRNRRGISAFYYNRYFGDKIEYYLRKANESIKIINSDISYNEREAVFIKSPFWDVQTSNLSEITIHINQSKIMQNGGGIRHFSKDLRSSNNLFHYVIQNSTIENNSFGGFQVFLPYVWQYNENFTHSVYFGQNIWQHNKKFAIYIRGHYAAVNITSNRFQHNQCQTSLIMLDGMEKKIKFDLNYFENNNAKAILEFNANSLSEIIGAVPARVEYNTLKNNFFEASSGNSRALSPYRRKHAKKEFFTTTAVVKLNGIQNVILYRNLIANNRLDYNLVAGVRSARLDNYFQATENWWGTTDTGLIQSKIFDFDNWNDHADVIYQPFLIEDTFDASISILKELKNTIDLASFSGGRIQTDLMIRKRATPYHIKSDITIMPEATVTIQHGVTMEFEANIGILVLGTLIATGYKESEIVMRPYKSKKLESLVQLEKRSLEDLSMPDNIESVRLCINHSNCSSDIKYGSSIKEGFLEYRNRTTMQWVPICDSRFTERNAQVVCRELGFDSTNVFYGHDRRTEFHTNSLSRIWSWVQPLECKGDELRMEECAERLNGQLYGHRHECHWDDVFVFVNCNDFPEETATWGGIRFANSKFEENLFENRFHDTHTHRGIKPKESRLEFVRIEHAGQLHNSKSAAIQAIFKNPKISSVSILNSVYHGINFIAPAGPINIQYVNISNALGTGINIVSLTGEGRESEESSYEPLKKLDLPYNLFSLIDICDPQKIHIIEEKVLVYYKYDNNPASCVKIFTSAFRAKPVGFRLLQSNLFNHSKLYGRADTLRLFEGDIYNITSEMIKSIEFDSKNQRAFIKSTGPTLSLQLIASGAPEHHGFIAEIVTVPISTIGPYRDALHNITNSFIKNCKKGAVSYLSAGEVTPTFTLTSNQIVQNCQQLYGNFSTCDSTLFLDVQNMNSFFFMNNLLRGNQGGLHIRADSRGSATALRGYIHHNLFSKNKNRPVLFIEGRQSSPYQEIEIFRNYFSQNNALYEDVIRLRQVVSNFSYNYVHANQGSRIVEISGFGKVRLPIYQTTSHNGFYRNIATSYDGKATIVAGTAGQQYVDNIFENPENDYEILTVNSTVRFSYDPRNSTIELWRSKIDARHNYWSYNNTISVQSRIRDQMDDPSLLEVEIMPFLMNNLTILDVKCPPGWNLIDDTCFTYIAAPMGFFEAREFCRSENASMPFIRTDREILWTYLQAQMQHLRYPEKVWIQDLNRIDRCTSFVFNEIELEDCTKLNGFLCEIDPQVTIDPLYWRADIFAISIISAFILAILLLIIIGFCWYAKSKHRHVQRLQRRNSIRQSLRSLNSIDPQGSLRRRTYNPSVSTGTLTKNSGQDYKQMLGNGSIDSMDKSVVSSEASFEHYDPQNNFPRPQTQFNEYVNHKTFETDTGKNINAKVATIGSASKALSNREKAVATAMDSKKQKPNIFELSYRNEGFRDTSTIGDTRNNSVRTSFTEDTPIMHQTDPEDNISDYYGNASTLPLRSANVDTLTFLSELKQTLPTYQQSNQRSQKSFPQNSEPANEKSGTSINSTLPYEQKIDKLNFTPLPQENNLSLYRSDQSALSDMRRPDSYYTAVRSSKAPIVHENKQRPKTVYKTANENTPNPYHRSKSEALLETDFDTNSTLATNLEKNARSYSQPLETAM